MVTQPNRPRGRGRRLEPGPIWSAAEAAGLRLLAPPDPNNTRFVAELSQLRPDLGVLTAYGRILGPALLKLPARGFINLHPSLLPAYRGAAPIQRALMAGCTTTGVTVIRMTEEVDAGDILNQEPVTVGPDETAGELSLRLANVGARLVTKTIGELLEGTAQARPQTQCCATHAPKVTDSERYLQWKRPASELHNLVRALSPKPCACTFFRSRRVLVLRSGLAQGTTTAQPGTILLDRPGLEVATGFGILSLLEVRPEAGKTQAGASFRNGLRPVPGERFESRDVECK